jgi:hypothetical protein
MYGKFYDFSNTGEESFAQILVPNQLFTFELFLHQTIYWSTNHNSTHKQNASLKALFSLAKNNELNLRQTKAEKNY